MKQAVAVIFVIVAGLVAVSLLGVDHVRRGMDLEENGDLDGAILEYGKAIEQDPMRTEAFVRRASARYTNGDTDGAIADYDRALQLVPGNKQLYFDRGVAKHSKRDFSGALPDFTRFVEAEPSNVDGHVYLGMVKTELDDMDGAIASLDRALDLNSSHDNALAYRAIAKMSKGDHKGAEEDYTRAYAINSANDHALVGRGYAKASRGDFDGAIEDYNNAIDLNSENAQAYMNRAHAKRDLALKKVRAGENAGSNGERLKELLESALGDFSRAVEINPEEPRVYFGRACTHYIMREWNLAVADLWTACEKDSDQEDYYRICSRATIRRRRTTLRNVWGRRCTSSWSMRSRRRNWSNSSASPSGPPEEGCRMAG